MYIHVLVCLAWNGPPPFEGALVLHLDDNPGNNKPANLRWGTAKENAAYRDMNSCEQRFAAEREWAKWKPSSSIDSDGFDWSGQGVSMLSRERFEDIRHLCNLGIADPEATEELLEEIIRLQTELRKRCVPLDRKTKGDQVLANGGQSDEGSRT